MLAVVETLTALPGQCKICGGAGKPWYLDTGTQEEYYGAVVYCSDCIGAIAEMCGFLTPASKERYEARISELESETYDLKVKLDGYREIQSGLNILAGGGSVLFGNPTPDSPVLEDSSPTTEGLSAQGESVGTGAGTDVESSDDKDVAGLHSSSGVDEGFRLNLGQ